MNKILWTKLSAGLDTIRAGFEGESYNMNLLNQSRRKVDLMTKILQIDANCKSTNVSGDYQ